MPKLEEIYHRLEANKKKRREINKMLKDELSQHARYQELLEEMRTLRDEKKSIEQDVKASASDFRELEDIKIEIDTDQEMLSDLALNMYVKNETVEIVDEYEQTWYPTFKVSFKKGH